MKVLLHHESMEGLMGLVQASLQSLRSYQHDPKVLAGSQAPLPPLDGSVVLLQKSLGSLSESATPVSYNRVPDSRGSGEDGPNGRHISLWMQWTVPSCCLVLETVTKQKITLALEDNSLSFDGQATYTKVKLRVRTLHSLVEARGPQGEYEPAPFPSCILNTKAGFLTKLSTISQVPGHEEPSGGLDDPPEISGQYSTGFSLTLTR